MARRSVLRMKDINRLRGCNWEHHYKNRSMIGALAVNREKEYIARVIERSVPPPVMRVDGSLVEGIATLKGMDDALRDLALAYTYRELMCVWYWSLAGWDNFVAQFQSLPEVVEDYYYFYDAQIDAALLMPMAKGNSGGTRGELGASGVVAPVYALKTG